MPLFRYVSEDSPRTYFQIPAVEVTTGQVYELPEGWNDPRWELVTDPAGVDVSLPDNVNPPAAQARPAPGAPAKGPIANPEPQAAPPVTPQAAPVPPAPAPVVVAPPAPSVVTETPAAPPAAQ